MFKDSKGVSVDRGGNRSEEAIIDLLREHTNYELLKAVIYLESSFCYEIPFKLKAKPLDNNKYHAEIHDSNERIELTKSRARKLPRNCSVIPAK